jgi:hypothetical protein
LMTSTLIILAFFITPSRTTIITTFVSAPPRPALVGAKWFCFNEQ